MLYAWIAIGLAFAASLGFGGIQTWNLRHCQQQSAKELAEHAVAIAAQNAKVSEWEGKAASAQAKSAQAVKAAIEASKRAKQRESSILEAPRPSLEASCEAREAATLGLIRRARTTR